LIKSIDGKEVTDLSPDGLAKVLEAIGGASRGEVNDILSSVKKK
jgi:hypothetical protein